MNLSPTMCNLIDALADAMVRSYLTAEAAGPQAQDTGRTDHAPLPAVDAAA